MMPPLLTLRYQLTSTTGWKRRFLLMALGVCATLALPPFFVFPLLIVSCSGLYWMVSGSPSPRAAFFTGWWWGLGFFVSGLYWICISLTIDMARFGWLIPFALIGLNGIIALYPALACWLYRRTNIGGIAGILLFCVLWSLTEYMRGILFTGFPWNYIGYTWTITPATMQPASIVGIHGLTLLTILLATLPAGLGYGYSKRIFLTTWMLWAVCVAWGVMRIPAEVAYDDTVNLRIVQANIPQELKWNNQHEVKGVQKHLSLSLQESDRPITHLIWPETAIVYALNHEPQLIRMLRNMLHEKKVLLTGALRTEDDVDTFKVWNSVYAIDAKHGIASFYDKHHLVPFGEFVPFRSILPVGKITHGSVDFSRGEGAVSLPIPNAPDVSPLVCYEAIFPDQAVAPDSRPGWLLNLTNDAWFGRSTGPYQHFNMVRVRAVEQGLPLIRAAGTGISAVIDPYGRIVASLDLNQTGIIDSLLPLPITQTFYAEHGNVNYVIMLLSIMIFIGFLYRNEKINLSKQIP